MIVNFRFLLLVLEHFYFAGEHSLESKRVIEFYHDATHDGLSRLDLGQTYMKAEYKAQDNP